MELVDLNTFISFLEYGTNLHISVVFFGDFGNAKMKLPFLRVIHSKPFCEKKKSEQKAFKRCFACRNLAIAKAKKLKIAFGGKCINGVYEYLRPVVIDGEVVAVIFIGNIYTDDIISDAETFEKNFDERKCDTLSLIVENHIKLLNSEYRSAANEYNPLITNVINYIDEVIFNDISVRDIATVFSYSEKYMGRLFKNETGVTIKEYINKNRVKKASALIKETLMSMSEISSRCGFNNVTYFNRIFKKYYNVSPLEYRKIHNLTL